MLSAASDIKHWLYANAVPLYTKGLSLNEFWHVGSPKTGIKGQLLIVEEINMPCVA